MLGRYLLITGTVRFAIEFIRVNERALFGLTVAHLVSLALIVVGGVMAARRPAANKTCNRRTEMKQGDNDGSHSL